MTTECICTTNTICNGQIYQPTKVSQRSKKSVWDGLRTLAGAIGDYAVDVYRYRNDPDAVFSNGGARVLIRSDRVDLV
jgi:hypothetical protein